MRRQRTEPNPTGNLPALRLQGKTIAFASKLATWWPDRGYPRLIEAEGGRVVEEVTTALDFLVVNKSCPRGQWAAEKKAEQLNQKKGGQIQILDCDAFFRLFAPRREEALALLRGGEEGLGRRNFLREDPTGGSPRSIPMPSLAGTDFNQASLPGVKLWRVNVNQCDFRGADLRAAHFGDANEANFDGARATGARFGDLTDCTFVGADLTGASFGDLHRTDLSGIAFEKGNLWRSTVKDSKFGGANLRQANLNKSRFDGNEYIGIDLTGANLEEATFTGESLAGVRLDNACLVRCDLSGAALVKASLSGADLTWARLANADLREADLRGANLANADLQGANLRGADFMGANTLGARIDPEQLSLARGLAPVAPGKAARPGPHLRELKDFTPQTQELKTSIVVEQGEDWIRLEAWCYKNRNRERNGTGWHLYSPMQKNRWEYEDPRSLSAGMLALANRCHGATPVLESVLVEAKKEPKGTDLWALAVCAWAEAFNLPVPDAAAIEELRSLRSAVRQRWRDQLIAELRTGPKGVERWNQRGIFLHQMLGDFTGADLRDCDLAGVRFYEVDLSAAQFDAAHLVRSEFYKCRAGSASFCRAKLEESGWQDSNLAAANLAKADFRRSSFPSCNFRGADFRGAGLEWARFEYGSLVGADLSTATLTDTHFERTEHDETTRWPAGHVPARGMRWLGSGPNPAIYHAARPLVPLDFETFMTRLAANTQPERLSKSLAMLKADCFQLFAEVSEEDLIGVVKSQTDPELADSCRLASDGSFGCCSPKLNPCGGMKDALCKHLLVLIVGLAKAGRVDRAHVDRWVEASHTKHPELDRDMMSDTFIRYKGAEAGEIDWRPTETIPEDYYAL
jgi:uncharacterized protein YjbI with pentapeptide repeats